MVNSLSTYIGLISQFSKIMAFTLISNMLLCILVPLDDKIKYKLVADILVIAYLTY